MTADQVLAEPDPLVRSVLREQLDLDVDEVTMLQHLEARLFPGIAET